MFVFVHALHYTLVTLWQWQALFPLFPLAALSIVEMKPLNVRGRVGESVEVKCSEWGRWSKVKYNDKYLCKSPCTEDKHVIIKAAYGKSNSTGRIQLFNIADGLFVNFTNLQKSDSGIYYCGAEKIGLDSFITVNLKVTDGE